MKRTIDLENEAIYTDLAIDPTCDLTSNLEIKKDKGIIITKLNVNCEISKKINKPIGNYLTIEFKDITDHLNREKVIKVFSRELKSFLGYKKYLIVGLGNRNSTPDSLGPRVVSKIVVTSHVASEKALEPGFSNVATFSPGVKGENGIDTFSLIKAISSFYNPDLIIVIDALVSTSLDRLNKTIQLTDTGINLNGNYLDKKSLKVPVLAIGVPTVIDLKTLISTNIDMMVTPKEIDFIVDSLAYIISSSLNKVLHKI